MKYDVQVLPWHLCSTFTSCSKWKYDLNKYFKICFSLHKFRFSWPLQQITDQLIDFLFWFLSTMSTYTLTWIKSYLINDIKYLEVRFLASVRCLDAIFLASYFLLHCSRFIGGIYVHLIMLMKPNWHLIFSNITISVMTSWHYFLWFMFILKFRMNFYRLGQVISFCLVFLHSDILTFNTVIIVCPMRIIVCFHL